jgi:hypothetical protein
MERAAVTGSYLIPFSIAVAATNGRVRGKSKSNLPARFSAYLRFVALRSFLSPVALPRHCRECSCPRSSCLSARMGIFCLLPLFIASAVNAFRLRVAFVVSSLQVLDNRWQFELLVFSLTKYENKITLLYRDACRTANNILLLKRY